MNTLTRAGIAVVAFTAGLFVATLEITADERAETDVVDWAARAKQTWNKTCLKCHTVPDTKYETDRAFLRQITETS